MWLNAKRQLAITMTGSCTPGKNGRFGKQLTIVKQYTASCAIVNFRSGK
jgi:hypothetical protein